MNHSTKINRAVKIYRGFKGPQTIQAILDQIPSVLFEVLSSNQLAAVMEAVNAGHQSGRAAEAREQAELR